MKFKFVEHTADVGVEAYGESLEETFINAALGLFEIMTDTSKVEEKEVREIKAKGEDLKSLLYDFLEQFLILHDSENLIFTKVVVKITNNELIGKVWGDVFDSTKHEDRTQVKAITYHDMSIEDKKIFYLVDI